MTTEHEDIDVEERDDAKVYIEALINGNTDVNRLARLTNTRFLSQARRTNKRTKEIRDELDTMREDIEPLVEVARFVLSVKHAVTTLGPAVGALLGGLFTLLIVLLTTGVIP